MKTLIVVRHGKSPQVDYVFSDLQRHLNAKGYEEAGKAAEWCRDQGYLPELLISSPAIRAFSTALVFAQYLGHAPGAIRMREEIYDASERTLLYLLQSLNESADIIAIFGHNPGFTEIVRTLAPGKISHMVTAGVAVIGFEAGQWSDIKPGTGKLIADNMG